MSGGTGKVLALLLFPPRLVPTQRGGRTRVERGQGREWQDKY